MGVSIPWEEAAVLIYELKRETGSHLFASESDWAFALSYEGQLMHLHTTGFLNVNRDTKIRPKPVEIPGPWTKTEAGEDVTPEERAEARAQLLRYSAFNREGEPEPVE